MSLNAFGVSGPGSGVLTQICIMVGLYEIYENLLVITLHSNVLIMLKL